MEEKIAQILKKEAEMGVKAQQIRLEEQGLKEASEKVLAEKMKELEVKISAVREKEGDYIRKQAQLGQGLQQLQEKQKKQDEILATKESNLKRDREALDAEKTQYK